MDSLPPTFCKRHGVVYWQESILGPKCQEAMQVASKTPHQMKRAVSSRKSEVLPPLCTAYLRLHLESCRRQINIKVVEQPQCRLVRQSAANRELPCD